MLWKMVRKASFFVTFFLLFVENQSNALVERSFAMVVWFEFHGGLNLCFKDKAFYWIEGNNVSKFIFIRHLHWFFALAGTLI